MKKGFEDAFNELDADFFCLQETKLQEGQIDLELPGYQSYWDYADKKGYSATAIFAKRPPLSVSRGLGIDQHDHEGRSVTLEYEDFYLVCVYTPNAQDELKRLDYRMSWEDAFRAYLMELDGKKPVIVCGDMNVAHTEDDLANPKPNRGKKGFTLEERGGFDGWLAAGFVDVFRRDHEGNGFYTWWSHFAKSRERNVGWRIDYWLASSDIAAKVTNPQIHPTVMGSDHCPVSIEV